MVTMSDQPSRTVGESMEETKERHRRYLRAMNNPLRREILRSMQNGNSDIESISKEIGVDGKTVGWHMKVLIDGFCVEEVEPGKFSLTQEGTVVDFLDQ